MTDMENITDRCLLVVDDEDNIKRAIKRLCRPKGYRVLLASSAEEAMPILSSEPVAVVMSDQRMPGKTGVEFFKDVKTQYPDIVRIMMSGYTALEGVTQAINEGAVFKFLFKPWDDEDLLRCLDEAFQYYHLREKNRQLVAELTELNNELENRVQEKTRDLMIHNRTLKISNELFDSLPYLVIGISEDGMIVEANRVARSLIHEGILVGLPYQEALPENISQFIASKIERGMTASGDMSESLEIDLQGQRFNLHIQKLNTPSDIQGALLYGETIMGNGR